MKAHLIKGREDLYLSAMTGADGTINAGYLVLFRSGRAVVIICAVMVLGAIVQAFYDEHHVFPFDALGKGIGLVLAAYGLELTSIGAFLWGDSKQTPLTTTTVTSTTQKPTE